MLSECQHIAFFDSLDLIGMDSNLSRFELMFGRAGAETKKFEHIMNTENMSNKKKYQPEVMNGVGKD